MARDEKPAVFWLSAFYDHLKAEQLREALPPSACNGWCITLSERKTVRHRRDQERRLTRVREASCSG